MLLLKYLTRYFRNEVGEGLGEQQKPRMAVCARVKQRRNTGERSSDVSLGTQPAAEHKNEGEHRKANLLQTTSVANQTKTTKPGSLRSLRRRHKTKAKSQNQGLCALGGIEA